MKGFIQIPILILLLVGTGASVYFIQQKTHFLSQAFSSIPSKEIIDLFVNQPIATKSAAQSFDYQLPTSTITNSSAPSLLSAFQRLLQRKAGQSPPSPTPVNISPAPTFKPTVSPSPTPVTPNYSTNTSSTCAINVGATPLDPNSNFDNPLTVLLTYSAHYTGNKYVTGAQWDFNGDGNWDTDMSLSNGSIPHTFPRSGSYNIKMQLRMSDGTMTPVCSKTATIPIGLAVSLTGHVFRDVNCNNFREPSEQGISGVTINFFKMPAFSLYATATSDSNGYYSLIKVINYGDNLSIQPGDIAAPGYKINALHQAITLNSNRPSSVYDLPQVPNENFGLCFPTPVPTPTPIFSTAKPVLTVSGPYTNGDSGPCFDLSSKHPYNYTQSADYKFDQNESSYRYTSLRDAGYSAIATVCWVKDPSKTGNQYILKAKSYVDVYEHDPIYSDEISLPYIHP